MYSNKKVEFSTIELDKIIDMYTNKKSSVKKISNSFGVSSTVITRVLKENGVKLRTVKENGKIYEFDEKYFDSIDTEEKAYWLGFIYADGFVTNGKVLCIKLSMTDIGHLKKFLNALSSNIPIHTYKTGENDKSFSGSNYEYCMVSITSKYMYNSLNKLGVVENKTDLIKFPEIEERLEKHFIRGFFDGDGSIYSSDKNKTKHLNYFASIVGNYEMIDGIRRRLSIKSKSKINKEKRCNNIYYISYSGRYAMDFYNIVYKDSSVYLDRKYKKFKEMINVQRL